MNCICTASRLGNRSATSTLSKSCNPSTDLLLSKVGRRMGPTTMVTMRSVGDTCSRMLVTGRATCSNCNTRIPGARHIGILKDSSEAQAPMLSTAQVSTQAHCGQWQTLSYTVELGDNILHNGSFHGVPVGRRPCVYALRSICRERSLPPAWVRNRPRDRTASSESRSTRSSRNKPACIVFERASTNMGMRSLLLPQYTAL